MPGSLSTYRKKRDFRITSEPKGKVAAPGKRLSFVIQKHAATRLHYDLRLELDGTLVSWAVPKGPSLDPAVKRMAVHVEDHPLGYADFEGVIPKGQYGAGTVIVWDRGEWEPIGDPRAGYRGGRLKFELHGEKLRGRWNLVRIRGRGEERQEPWLLIKEEDEEARPAGEYDVVEALPDSVLAKPKRAKDKPQAAPPRAARKTSARSAANAMPSDAAPAKLPLFFAPQLATLVDEAPEGGDWIYEVKFDGYRVLARIDGDDVKLFTRNGNDWTARLRGLADEFRSLGIGSAWIDGEIVVMNEAGIPDFQLLQRAFDNASTKNIVFFAFDLPHFGGYDLTRLPLVQRRAFLEKVFAKNKSPRLRFSDQFAGPVEPLLEAACKQGLEGLIGKRAAAPYASSRSSAWVKIKCSRRQEFVVVGHTDPKGSRTGFGSLLLAVHDAKTGERRYAGSVGTGFDEKLLRSIKAKLDALATTTPPLKVPKGVKGHWVRPKLVAEVAFTEWTGDGKVRHPVFHGLRADKAPETVTRETAVETPPEPPAERPRRAARSAKKPSAAGAIVGGMAVSSGERVIDPSTGFTKLDLVRYYDRIAPHILPHLAGRPSTLVRAPAGIEGQRFFQKHADTLQIPGVREFERALWPGHDPMIEIATREALLGAAQMNVVELHTSNVTIDRRAARAAVRKPDRLIFDLDPGEGITWARLLEATALMKEMLDLLELESFPKTSGGKGLHVVVPIEPAWDWDGVKDFSQEVAVHMARTLPQLFVAKSGAGNRLGRIFIDYLRNSFQASTIAAFSARARPGLGVSVPLAWSELAKLEAANQWTIGNVHERLARLRADPWKDYAKTRQSLARAAKLLAAAKT